MAPITVAIPAAVTSDDSRLAAATTVASVAPPTDEVVVGRSPTGAGWI